MKRLLCSLLVLSCIFCLCACDAENDEANVEEMMEMLKNVGF